MQQMERIFYYLGRKLNPLFIFNLKLNSGVFNQGTLLQIYISGSYVQLFLSITFRVIYSK